MCSFSPSGIRSVIPEMAEEVPRIVSEGLVPQMSSHFLMYMQENGHRDLLC